MYAAASGFLFTACQKEESTAPELPSGSKAATTVNVSPVPATFIKKVLVEELTSATNGDAPQSAYDLAGVTRTNPDRIIPVSMHINDIMANVQSNRLLSTFAFSLTNVPCALISRFSYAGNSCIPSSLYNNAVSANLQKPVECGIAINSSISGRIAQVDVHTGFANTLNSTYKVHAYLVEDKISNANPAFYQANSYNNTPGSPFYNLGNPIRNYTYQNVVRKVISSPGGDNVNPMAQVAGGSDVVTYKLDIPQKYNSNSKWYLVAFITDNTSNEVLNVQSAELGTLKDWN